ncbi:MAG TPA: hypothetical protein VGO11_14660 [Chthoniobacteraceae bacterium]|jgi:hypothetical protein|nr:hypothetical protein [Chthoniobacteraceae bacterium]
MPIPFRPLPEDEPPLTIPQFLRRLEHDPAFAAKMRKHYETQLVIPLSPESEEMHKRTEAAFRTFKHHQGVVHTKRKMAELDKWVENPTLPESERYERCARVLEEARDYALDMLEPERTSTMKRIADTQSALQKLRETE